MEKQAIWESIYEILVPHGIKFIVRFCGNKYQNCYLGNTKDRI
jgi:hypothetical protein